MHATHKSAEFEQDGGVSMLSCNLAVHVQLQHSKAGLQGFPGC